MDFTNWHDELANALADYAVGQHGRHVHLHTFAQHYLADRNLNPNSWTDVVLASLDICGLVGVPRNSPSFTLTHRQINELRQPYERWQAIGSIPVSPQQRLLLEALNRLSCVEVDGVWTTNDVDPRVILAEPEVAAAHPAITADLAIEELAESASYDLVKPHLTIAQSQYKSTYAGVTRVTREQVLEDREIDELRTQGESDSLDYKRQIDTRSRTAKAEFTKDVVAFANAGGSTKHILVGVEDDGTFTVPDDPVLHQQLISRLGETTLQQIVSERTIQTPSIRIIVRGQHREGPYVVIEIKTDVRHLPYRFFSNPADSKLPGAAQSGEIWIRKGSTKHLATPDEVAALEQRAAGYRQLHP